MAISMKAKQNTSTVLEHEKLRLVLYFRKFSNSMYQILYEPKSEVGDFLVSQLYVNSVSRRHYFTLQKINWYLD